MTAVLSSKTAAAIDHDGLANAIHLMQQRQSVRRYTSYALSEGVLNELLRCATLAPSAHNRQPWRFAVLRSIDAKVRLARAMGERLRHDRLEDQDDLKAVEADVARSFARIIGAPLVLLVASSLQPMDCYPDEQRHAAEAAMALQSTAMAVQNLLLAASAAGLGACWMCAPMFCPEIARDALSLPSDWQPQGLVTLGVPQVAPKLRARLPLDAVVWREGAI